MSEKTLWRKCGNLIKNSDETLTRCDSSPCGYYAIFGFKYRYLDCQTMNPTDCREYSSVTVAHVTDRYVIWNDFVQPICIPVSQKKGLCGTKKAKCNCWEECIQWDENYQNCLETVEHCTCLQIEVYNISGCFDDYAKFAEFFYTPCGITENFPEIFEASYLSDSARDCLNNYWLAFFNKHYMLNFKLYHYGQQNHWSLHCNYFQSYYLKYYNCLDENGEIVSSGTTPCQEDGLVTGWIDEYWSHQLSQGAYAYNMDNSENNIYVKTGGYWDGTEYHTSCCVDIGTVAGLPEVNAYVQNQAETKSSYTQKGGNNQTCTNSNSLCLTLEYKSQPYENWYNDVMNLLVVYRWYKLKIEKLDNTPDEAIGIKFSAKITHTKTNQGRNDGNVKAEIITEEETTYDIFFDEVFQGLPLATDITLMSYLETPSCTADCRSYDGGEWRIQPYVYGVASYDQDCWTDKFKIELKAIEYIKGE